MTSICWIINKDTLIDNRDYFACDLQFYYMVFSKVSHPSISQLYHKYLPGATQLKKRSWVPTAPEVALSWCSSFIYGTCPELSFISLSSWITNLLCFKTNCAPLTFFSPGNVAFTDFLGSGTVYSLKWTLVSWLHGTSRWLILHYFA